MSRPGFRRKKHVQITLSPRGSYWSSRSSGPLDFEKAFDSVDSKVLWKLLRHNGLTEKYKYITLIQKTYDNCSCTVIYNGVLSELIEMLTGAHQGCSLSPFLFLLVIDWIMRQTTDRETARWYKVDPHDLAKRFRLC